MNTNRILLFLVYLFTLICSLGSNSVNERTFFSEGLVGKWKGGTQFTNGSDNHVQEIQIDIVDSEHLFYYSSFDLESDDGEVYGIPLKIQFKSEKQVILQGRISDQWNIELQGNNLLISNGILFDKQTVMLTRVPRVERFFVFLGGIFIVGLMYFVPSLKTSRIIRERVETAQKANRYQKLGKGIVDFTLHTLIITVTVVIVIWGFLQITASSYFYFLGMPWRVFIGMEASLCLFIIGNKIRSVDYKSNESPTFTPGAMKYYFSMVLSIASVLGIIVSLVMWATFMIMVRSYLGAWYLY